MNGFFKMPRVVPDQKFKFENDEFFRSLSHESEIRYTGYQERAFEERQMLFQHGCREGHTVITFVASGTNLILIFNAALSPFILYKDPRKVHLKTRGIINGVCIRFRGWIDLERLDGVGWLEYDEFRAMNEDAIFRCQIHQLCEFEDYKRAAMDSLRARACVAVGGIEIGAPSIWTPLKLDTFKCNTLYHYSIFS